LKNTFLNFFASLHGRLALFIALLTMAIWAVVNMGVQRSLENLESANRRELSNWSWAFAKTVESAFETIDLTAIDLREHWIEHPEDFQQTVQVMQKQLERDVAFQVAIIGADGLLVFSNLDPKAKGVDLSDREHFQIHRHRHTDTLFVSKPVLGRISKRWSIQFTRPIFKPDGAFAGVIVLSVATEHFTRFYDTINFRDDSVSSVLNHNGHIIARYPTADNANSMSFPVSEFISEPGLPAQGWLTKVSPIDQVERLYIWRKVNNQDIFVLLGVSKEGLSAAYRSQRNVYIAAGFIASLLLLLFGSAFASKARQLGKTNRRLQESEERWAFALVGGGDGVWDWDLTRNQVLRSKRWHEILGLDEDEIDPSNETWSSRIHPDDIERVQTTVQAHLDGSSERYAIEYRLRASDGHWLWVLDRGMAIRRDPQGKALRLVGTISDITARRESEQLLINSQRFLHTLTDALPNLLSYWNPDMSCAFANLAFHKAFARSDQLILGMAMRDLMNDNVFALNAVHFKSALMGQAQQFESHLQHPDGTVAHYWVQYLPDQIDQQMRGVISVATNVSEIKQAQVKLEQLNSQLHARTQEAIKASQAKSMFLSNISHEIRTPMNSIIGMTDMALLRNPDTPSREYLEIVSKSAQSLLVIINEVLEFSKIEAGKLTLIRALFDLNQVIQDTVLPLHVIAAKKSLPINVCIDPDVPTALIGDAGRLQQILINLLGNAIKFTPNGHISLAVTLDNISYPNVTLAFSVRDTGIGIDPSRQADIFEAFGQESPLTAKTYGGTGLGLSISRRLVEQMQGKIQLTSVPKQGSHFYFTVTLQQPALANKAIAVPLIRRQPALRERSKATSLTILLVEDYPANQIYALNLLNFLGHQVTVANHGQEAVDYLDKQFFDVVLMDLQMPVMDGMEATRRIRAAESASKRPRVRIIAISAIIQNSEIEACYAVGMDDFLAKPFTPAELEKHLQ